MAWVAGCSAQADTAGRLGREAIRKLLPGSAAIHRAENSAAGAAVIEVPRIAGHAPQSREQNHGIARIHDQRTHACILVNKEDFLPILAAVGGTKNTTFRVRSPGVAQDT